MPQREDTCSGSRSLNSPSFPAQVMIEEYFSSWRSSSRNCHSCICPVQMWTLYMYVQETGDDDDKWTTLWLPCFPNPYVFLISSSSLLISLPLSPPPLCFSLLLFIYLPLSKETVAFEAENAIQWRRKDDSLIRYHSNYANWPNKVHVCPTLS